LCIFFTFSFTDLKKRLYNFLVSLGPDLRRQPNKEIDMKKLGIVAVLLAAGAFAASGLFAQEIKFDGYVNSGLGVVYSNEEGAPDPFIAAVGNDSWNNAWTVRLNASYTNEAGNAGALVRLSAAGGYSWIGVPIGYGWFSAFDKLLTVKGGIVDDGTWNTGGTYLNGDMSEGLGALAKITPITGLDIGLGVFLAETPLGSQNNQEIADQHIAQGGRYYVHELDEAKYTFSAGYTLPDLVKIVASYRPKSTAGTGVASEYLPSRARVGVSLLAVPNLKANVELELDNLQDFSGLKNGEEDAWGRKVGSPAVAAVPAHPEIVLPNNGGTIAANPGSAAIPAGPSATAASGKINIYQTIQYDMGSLSVGLWAAEWLSQAEDADFAFYANPWVSYALGNIVPRLDLGYGSATRAGFNNTGLNWRRVNYSAMYDSDYSIIAIRPSVKFNIDSKTFVEIGDLLDIDGGKWGDDDSRISNAFYIDFKWTF
jgi:hypothetical protein